MQELLTSPWPWYIAGPLIGLMVPALLILGGKLFGVSSNYRHICAATMPANNSFFKYDWKRQGGSNLVFVLGVLLGGFLAGTFMTPADMQIDLSAATVEDLRELGIDEVSGWVPAELFSWSALTSLPG